MILDASAAVATFGDPAVAQSLRGEELLAPDLIVAETLNAFWKLRLAGRDVPDRSLLLSFLDDIRIVPARRLAARAAALAEQLEHPVYDCLYVALAEAEDDRLLTADRRLANKLPRALRARIRFVG